MLTEKNFSAALKAMNFTERGNFFEKTFADGVVMSADLNAKKLSYPAQVKGRDHNTSCDESHKENLVVFECVNRLLDKGYKPEDIELEKNWQLGHTQKSGRADICVSQGGKIIFIIECKTFGAEYNHELANMKQDGGQLFSYWQQENSCQWLMLYASGFDGELKFEAASVFCGEKIYRDAHTVPERFKIWSDRYEKKFLGDVIFHDETRAYQIGVKPLRKRDLKDFSENKSVVNKFEEILRHNQVSNKETAFNRLIALFICKLVDETNTPDDGEVSFQFKDGVDTNETFQDRLQRLYAEGMEKFMKEPITYVPLARVDELLNQIGKVRREELSAAFKNDYRKLKFFNNNAFAFIDVHNEKLFYINAKILAEVVDILKDYKIIGSKDLQTLGDLFEQLLDKGFKQNEGQFFTPIPIAHFIWDSLPLDEIIFDTPPKIIDYACGAGHFLTEGFKAVNDCFARKNFPLPLLWERDKIFGVEKDDRLARVSKISLFMHGANGGKIKFGDGLENYPDENITPATFDILVANPPYSVKGFKAHLKLDNKNFEVLDKISNDGSEIETLFVERIAQLVKPRGIAAVILPSSILNKDGKSFVAAREALLKNFYLRAIVQLGNKTFSATSVSTVILFLQKIFDPPERAELLKDSAKIILSKSILPGDEEEKIFDGYLKKTGKTAADLTDSDREKIIYFGLTYRQRTLIVSAPDKNDEQEKFLGYGWSNAKGREGIVHKKLGGLLFDNDNRDADNTIAAAVRAAFRGQQLNLPELEKYFRFVTTADLLDFDADNFNKTIRLVKSDYVPVEYSGDFELVKLGEVCEINIPKSEVASVEDDTLVSFVEMASVSNNGFIAEKVNRPLGEVRKGGYKYFSEGDIIIAKITPCMENGKCAIARGLTNSIGFGSTEFHVFRCNQEKILTEYLFVFLNREDIRQAAKAHMTGSSGHKRVPENFYSKLMLPLPPADIQIKIVEDFKALDTQLDSLEKNIQQLDADIQAKFAALFDGKNNFMRLDKIADEIIQGTSPKSEFYNDSGEGLPFYQGKKDFGEQFLNQPTMWTTETIKISIKGDILMSVRAPVGDVNLNPFDKICIGRGLAAIRCHKTSTRNYVFHWLHFHSDEIDGHKGSTFDSISGNEIRAIKLPLPPLELQEEFAAYVRACEAQKENARQQKENLIREREELVTKYFR